MINIKVKFRNKICQEFEYIDGKSDWIDLRAAQTVRFKPLEFKLIDLGFAMQLPSGYEAYVVPRSSTYKNFGIIQANSVGIIDNSYCGNDDYWMFPAIALKPTVVNEGDRICQFRISRKMDKVSFEKVNFLSNINRGGFGSTGIK